MKKKIILKVSIFLLMFLVILYAYFQKDNKSVNIKNNDENIEKESSENVDDPYGVLNNKKYKNKKACELEIYSIGDDIELDYLLPLGVGIIKPSTLLYTINSVKKVDKIEGVPDDIMPDVEFFVDDDGKPSGDNMIYEINYTVKNIMSTGFSAPLSVIHQYSPDINSQNIYGSEGGGIICNTDFDEQRKTSDFKYFKSGDSYTTTVYFNVTKEELGEKNYLIIDPNGSGYEHSSAALVDVSDVMKKDN